MFREPDPPNFARLPPGIERDFQQRRERLPIHRVRSRVSADAIMLNEVRFVHAFAREHALPEAEAMALGTWHMRATHDLLSSARPDLVPARRASGSVMGVASRRSSRLRRLLLRLNRWNTVVGWPTWVRNRVIDCRAAFFRWSGSIDTP